MGKRENIAEALERRIAPRREALLVLPAAQQAAELAVIAISVARETLGFDLAVECAENARLFDVVVEAMACVFQRRLGLETDLKPAIAARLRRATVQ